MVIRSELTRQNLSKCQPSYQKGVSSFGGRTNLHRGRMTPKEMRYKEGIEMVPCVLLLFRNSGEIRSLYLHWASYHIQFIDSYPLLLEESAF